MKNKGNLLLIVCSMLVTTVLNAQQKEVVITVDTLSNAVYMLTGQGGNIGIYVGERHVFMIDDQFDRLSDKIKTAIASLTDKPISFLFNTHMHGDHSGGNANFNTFGTTLVAHENVRERISTGQKKKLEARKITQEYYNKMLPEVTFSDDINFYDADETIMGVHVHNAHTDGDAMIYFVKNNVLHMGDTYFSGRYPYIDLKNGGSVVGYIEANKKALMLINDNTKIIPGHGKLSNKKELESYIAMLEDIKTNVETAIANGKSLEEIKTDPNISNAYDAFYGGGFINPEKLRETFYISLKE